jgi:hypothetical protein
MIHSYFIDYQALMKYQKYLTMQPFTKKHIVICTIQIEQVFNKTHTNSSDCCMMILLATKFNF